MKIPLIQMNIIFPIIVLFLNTSGPLASGNFGEAENQDSIFLVKNYWHTGIVLTVKNINIPELQDFSGYEYVDIGWGDEEFYQYPDFDAALAVKALFYPTPSALRVEGFNLSIKRYIDLSDMAVLILVNDEQLKTIVKYISSSFYTQEGKPVLLSSRTGGNTRFYKAIGEYHLFNTCNTWIAGGLNSAGIDIDEHIILAEQLFKQAAEVGKVLKVK